MKSYFSYLSTKTYVVGTQKNRLLSAETISSDKMTKDISETLLLLHFVNKMSEHRYDIRISESCADPNPLMVERQDPDNFTRFQTRERCLLEIAAYVFNWHLGHCLVAPTTGSYLRKL